MTAQKVIYTNDLEVDPQSDTDSSELMFVLVDVMLSVAMRLDAVSVV